MAIKPISAPPSVPQSQHAEVQRVEVSMDFTKLSDLKNPLESRHDDLCMLFSAVAVVCIAAAVLGAFFGAPLPGLYVLPIVVPTVALCVVKQQIKDVEEKTSELWKRIADPRPSATQQVAHSPAQ